MSQKVTESFSNKRNFGRADMILAPLSGSVSIDSINGEKSALSGSSKIAIINFGAGGLRFLSTLFFPIHKEISLRVKFSVEDLDFDELGVLIWNSNSVVVLDNNEFKAAEYGFNFTDSVEKEVKRRVNATFRLQRIMRDLHYRSGVYARQFDLDTTLYALWKQVHQEIAKNRVK